MHACLYSTEGQKNRNNRKKLDGLFNLTNEDQKRYLIRKKFSLDPRSSQGEDILKSTEWTVMNNTVLITDNDLHTYFDGIEIYKPVIVEERPTKKIKPFRPPTLRRNDSVIQLDEEVALTGATNETNIPLIDLTDDEDDINVDNNVPKENIEQKQKENFKETEKVVKKVNGKTLNDANEANGDAIENVKQNQIQKSKGKEKAADKLKEKTLKVQSKEIKTAKELLLTLKENETPVQSSSSIEKPTSKKKNKRALKSKEEGPINGSVEPAKLPVQSSSVSKPKKKKFKSPLLPPQLLTFDEDHQFYFPSRAQHFRFPLQLKLNTSLQTNFNEINLYLKNLLCCWIESIQITINTKADELFKTFPNTNSGIRNAEQTERDWRKKGFGLHLETCMYSYSQEKERYYIKIKNRLNANDIWILKRGKSLEFKAEEVVIMRSNWHGLNQQSVMELRCLNPTDHEWLFSKVPKFWQLKENGEEEPAKDNLWIALKLDNLSTDLMILELLKRQIETDEEELIEEFPLLQFVSHPNAEIEMKSLLPPSDLNYKEIIENLFEDFCQDFQLNQEQKEFIECFSMKLLATKNPILPLHGAFGTGKTKTLSSLILFLYRLKNHLDQLIDLEQFEQEHLFFPLLLASHTNLAVDSVISLCLDLGLPPESIARVGCERRVMSSIKEKGIWMVGGNAGIEETNLAPETVTSVFLVGTTCISSLSPNFHHLSAESFPILLLDESTQMLEPMSLLPLSRFASKRVVMVGDPLQLGPIIPDSLIVPPKHGLERSLFERLEQAGCPSLYLRRQYRCHPDISQLANLLFYKNRLFDGISASQRPPLVNNWPALLWVEVEKGSEKRVSKGWMNTTEAQSIIDGIFYLILKKNIPTSKIGVICLYRAQVDCVLKCFHTTKQNYPHLLELETPAISTIDAFQGGEKEIVFVSTVRQGGHDQTFLNDSRRMNVALTRARTHLILFHSSSVTVESKTSLWQRIKATCLQIGKVWSLTEYHLQVK